MRLTSHIVGREQRGDEHAGTISPGENGLSQDQHKIGRNISVTPSNSTNKHLAYGRIILNASVPSVRFANGNQETGLICMSGSATVSVDGKPFQLGQYDGIYIPRDSQIEVSTKADVDLVELSSDVENRYPLQFVSYAEISKDPTLKFDAGAPGQARHLNIRFRKERRSRTAGRGLYFFGTGQLDELAAARAHRDSGRNVYLLRYAGAGLWVAVGVRQHGVSGDGSSGARRRRGADAQRLSPQRFRSRPQDLFHLGDGRASRES